MTDENVAAHIVTELRRARALRDEATVAAGVGLHGRAAGALYFAALHACRALLASKGLEPKSHTGVRALVSLHFVKPGALPALVVRALSDLQEAREGSDYVAAYTVSADEYAALERSCDAILDAAGALLEHDRNTEPSAS